MQIVGCRFTAGTFLESRFLGCRNWRGEFWPGRFLLLHSRVQIYFAEIREHVFWWACFIFWLEVLCDWFVARAGGHNTAKHPTKRTLPPHNHDRLLIRHQTTSTHDHCAFMAVQHKIYTKYTLLFYGSASLSQHSWLVERGRTKMVGSLANHVTGC